MPFAQVLLLGAIAGFTIFLGLPVARLPGKEGLRAVLNAVSIGILVFLLIEVSYPALEATEEGFKAAASGGGTLGTALGYAAVLVGGFTAGLLGLTLFDQATIRRQGAAISPHRLALMIATGIGLHNFSEGLAIGNSFAQGQLGLAWILVVGFALHNATEGFGIAGPLTGEKATWGFLFLCGLIGGGPTFIGTLLGSAWTNDYVSKLFLALAAGAILYVVIELLNVGRKANRPVAVIAGLLAGFFIASGSEMVIEAGPSFLAAQARPARVVDVEASEFYFSPPHLVLKANEPVVINVKNVGKVQHEFEVKALGIEEQIAPGAVAKVALRPTQEGKYDIACDLPGHSEAGMVGTLEVVD